MRQMRRRRTGRGLFALLLLAALPVLATGAQAAIPGPDGLISACFVNRTGALRVTDPPAIRACKPSETALAWPFRAWHLDGNAGTSPGTHFLGTKDNVPLELKVNGARAVRLEPNVDSPNLIGGFAGNFVTAGAFGAAIGGGGQSGLANRVTDAFGTVAGGRNNQAGDGLGTADDRLGATVGGGRGNTARNGAATVAGGQGNAASGVWATVGGGVVNAASGDKASVGGGAINTSTGENAVIAGGSDNIASNVNTTVGGGIENTASGFNATVGGGNDNTASGFNATVGGGFGNSASGFDATVPGGSTNEAVGRNSFAAGHRAKANHQGAFVWADSRVHDFTSSAVNEFSVRATGGVRFVSGIDGFTGAPTAGVHLAPGASAWSVLSDRAAKQHVVPVDGRAILARLARIPIQSWSYRAQEPSIRHLGPMAQDFYRAFGLGEDRRYINTLDADGVALAAIQGLHRLARDKEARIRRLERKNAALDARLARLERLVARR